MDYLDWELSAYQDDQAQICDICGEYNDEDWRCDCCHDCEKSSCECEEEDIHLGI